MKIETYGLKSKTIKDQSIIYNSIFIKRYSFFIFRLDNGTFIGMIREVQDGIVDASIAGFSATQERFEVVDFSQGLFPYLQTLIIKRPLKTDISVRYFWLGKKDCMYIEERCSNFIIS